MLITDARCMFVSRRPFITSPVGGHVLETEACNKAATCATALTWRGEDNDQHPRQVVSTASMSVTQCYIVDLCILGNN